MKPRPSRPRPADSEPTSPPRTGRVPVMGLVFLVPAAIAVFLAVQLVLPWVEGFGVPASGADGAAILTAAHDPVLREAASPAPASKTAISLDSPRVAGAPGNGAFWIDAPDGQVADLLVASMDDDEMLGQLFLFGWPKETAVGPIMDWLKQRNLGGIKVFGWNGAKLATLAQAISQMQAIALGSRLGIPLYTATDQEGGMVRHIKDSTSVTPGNLALGADRLAADAYESARLIGRELRAIGINMNFAPTVDVYVNPEAHVIGPRAFGSNAEEVAWLGLAAMEGYRSSRVIATAKHFPGHGDASGDSHGMMPILSEKLDALWNRDFLPYRLMIPEGLPAILIGHLAFPSISGNDMPASLSAALNQKLLRDRLHFDGIVITDDLFMGGASVYATRLGWGMSDIVIEAIRAGNDIIMMSRTPELQDAIWLKVKARYAADPAFRDQVRQAVRRSLLVKLAYLKPADRVPLAPDPATVYRAVPDPGAAGFFLNQAGRSVTVLARAAIPFQPPSGSRIALIGQEGGFLRAAQAAWPAAEVLRFNTEPFARGDAATIAQAQALAQRADWVVFGLANPNSRDVLAALKPWRAKILVVSTLTPVYLEALPWVETAVAVYGQGDDSYRFGIAALQGGYQAPGRLPVRTRP